MRGHFRAQRGGENNAGARDHRAFGADFRTDRGESEDSIRISAAASGDGAALANDRAGCGGDGDVVDETVGMDGRGTWARSGSDGGDECAGPGAKTVRAVERRAAAEAFAYRGAGDSAGCADLR